MITFVCVVGLSLVCHIAERFYDKSFGAGERDCGNEGCLSRCQRRSRMAFLTRKPSFSFDRGRFMDTQEKIDASPSPVFRASSTPKRPFSLFWKKKD